MNCSSLYFNGPFSEVKRPECDVYHSPPSSADGKNEWSCTSPPPYLHGVGRYSRTILYEGVVWRIRSSEMLCRVDW